MPGPSTNAVHAGEVPDPRTGAVNVPVHMSSTFWYPELPDGGKSQYIYSRYTNPSVDAVEAKLAALEGAEGSLLFSSGMGAIMTACTGLLQAGDTIAVQQGIYGGTTAFLREELDRFGIRMHMLPEAATPKVPRGTKLVWMESITNPLLRVAHVPEWAAAAHEAGARLCVDATFASPILQRPLELGADLVMQSATKYLGGHSDLIAGALSWRKKAGVRDALWRVRRNWGPSLDPHAAYLLGRGMKTLALRMRRHCDNAQALAEAAGEMPGVRAVHYPGLSDHPDRATTKRVLPDGCGGVVTLDLGTLKAAQRFRRKVKVIAPAASLGGVESLVSLPIETSHAYQTAQEREALGIGDGLVRISVGIEDIDDLIADVARATK
ncbi:MAG: PLP-dependent aspartate aminotransferase family protein [bacterium]